MYGESTAFKVFFPIQVDKYLISTRFNQTKPQKIDLIPLFNYGFTSHKFALKFRCNYFAIKFVFVMCKER